MLVEELVNQFRAEIIRPWLYALPEGMRLELATNLVRVLRANVESLTASERSLRAELRGICLLVAVSAEDDRALETYRRIA